MSKKRAERVIFSLKYMRFPCIITSYHWISKGVLFDNSGCHMKTTVETFIPTARKNFWPMLKSEWLQWRLNKTPLWNIPLRNWLLKHLFASIDGSPFAIQIPFHISDGSRTHIGKNFVANYNVAIFDHGGVRIGDNVMIASNVVITTVFHPMNANERIFYYCPDSFEPHKRADTELCAPISIGNNVWIAAGTIICPGVTIGDNTVIGAGSVVTRDIPANVFACGVPCRVVRTLSNTDKTDCQTL